MVRWLSKGPVKFSPLHYFCGNMYSFVSLIVCRIMHMYLIFHTVLIIYNAFAWLFTSSPFCKRTSCFVFVVTTFVYVWGIGDCITHSHISNFSYFETNERIFASKVHRCIINILCIIHGYSPLNELSFENENPMHCRRSNELPTMICLLAFFSLLKISLSQKQRHYSYDSRITRKVFKKLGIKWLLI